LSQPAPTSRRQLLVSVQNVREAQLARSLCVPWIDLKNPALGSLGRPDLLTARKVAAVLAASEGTPVCQTSVALGELRTLNLSAALDLMRLFPVAKVGLAGLGTSRRSSSTLWQQLDLLQSRRTDSGQVVLAIYADYERAGAPAPLEVIEIANRLGSRYVLIDTFIKDGQGLFRWLTLEELRQLGERAASSGATLVLAGSLKSSDWPLLSQLGSVIVGVRGGVCSSDADRSSRLSADRLRQWLEWSRTEAQFN
jgi:uncharacterized protein (UPF0264 family)